MTDTTQIKMPGTPPAWMNAAVRAMLHTPLIQRLVGRTFAMMTVTGAKTGRRYTTPVQYLVHGDEFVVLSQRMRKWWRNIASEPEVKLRIQGRSITGRARIASDDEAGPILSDCLAAEPRVAKFYGIESGSDGTVDAADIDRLLSGFVVLAVEIPTMEPEFTVEDFADSMR